MFCACCGNELGEGQVCRQCGWSVGEAAMPVGQFEQPQGEGAAIASLVIGVVSWSMCFGFGILPLIGFILGVMGLKCRQPGIAVAGIIINAAVLVLFVMIFALLALFGIMGATSFPVSSGRCC